MAIRGTLKHRKTRRLARLLGVDQSAALGILEALWELAADQKQPTGDLSKFTPEDIAEECYTSVDPKVLYDGLVEAGWLDINLPNGVQCYVHDYHDWADDAVKMKLARNGVRFANGEIPSLTKLNKDQRDKIMARYDVADPCPVEPSREHISAVVRTDAHISALPVPVPEPEPVIVLPSEEEDRGAREENSPKEPVLAWTDGAPYWEKANEPMRSVGLCLCAVHVALDQPPPEVRKISRFVGESQGCRQMVDREGWQKAASVYVFAVQTSNVTSWATVNDNSAAYASRMEKGIQQVPRGRTLAAAEPKTSFAQETRDLIERAKDHFNAA